MACVDLWSGSIIVVISVPRWSPGSQAACLDLPASQSVYSKPRQQGKGRGLVTRLDASVQLQQQHSCLFIWRVDTGGFSLLCCPPLLKCLFYLQYRQRQTKCPRRCSGVRYSIYVFDQLFSKTAAISHRTSINVRIEPVKTSTEHVNYPVSFKVCSHLKVCAPMWNHAWVCCAVSVGSKPPLFDLSFTFSFNLSATACFPHIYPNLLAPHHQEATPCRDTRPLITN